MKLTGEDRVLDVAAGLECLSELVSLLPFLLELLLVFLSRWALLLLYPLVLPLALEWATKNRVSR
jgi:hypothetical protein